MVGPLYEDPQSENHGGHHEDTGSGLAGIAGDTASICKDCAAACDKCPEAMQAA